MASPVYEPNKYLSPLQEKRRKYVCELPLCLKDNFCFEEIGDITEAVDHPDDIKEKLATTYAQKNLCIGTKLVEMRPYRVGVLFSGGQAPGGHNVIAGLYDRLMLIDPYSCLFGFLNGPQGLINDKYIVLTESIIDAYRNLGGFDMIYSSRTKLNTEEQFNSTAKTCQKLGLDGLVVIGGDDSNTNAALLAEYFKSMSLRTVVVGCPKTIDNDLTNDKIRQSFGFDSASKVYASLVANVETDARSARKYYHFCRVMGREASHLALEVALQTQPNIVLMSEEVAKNETSLEEIAVYVADVVRKRARLGKNFGIVVIPEGLIESIPSFGNLIRRMNPILKDCEERKEIVTVEMMNDKLKDYPDDLKAFKDVPPLVQVQMMSHLDPHSNVQVSKIETGKLVALKVQSILQNDKEFMAIGGKFNWVAHFFGYEGRCVNPSNFDATYCSTLGHIAALLIADKRTGYIACASNIASMEGPSAWGAEAMALGSMMGIEMKAGKQGKMEKKPVIKKRLVQLDGGPFTYLVENRKLWELEDCYLDPGGIHYENDVISNRITKTLELVNLHN